MGLYKILPFVSSYVFRTVKVIRLSKSLYAEEAENITINFTEFKVVSKN